MALNGPRGGEEARVAVKVALEVDPSLVEEGPHDLVRLPEASERPGSLPLHVVLVEHRDVPDREDDLGTSSRQLVEGRRLLRDQGRVAQEEVGS